MDASSFGGVFSSFFIGTLFTTMLYGITCAQILYYMSEYPNDKPYLRLLVVVLWILDTGATICDILLVWLYLVTNHYTSPTIRVWGDHGVVVIDKPIILQVQYALAAVAVLIVNLFYIQTVWRLLKANWYRLPISVTMVILAVISCAGSCLTAFFGMEATRTPSVFFYAMTIPGILQPAAASVVDISITVVLSWTLRKERTGLRQTDNLIRRVVIYSVNRGLLTATIQMAQLVSYCITLGTFYWAIFHFPGSSIYVNSALAMLNARHYISGKHDVTSGLFLEDPAVDKMLVEDVHPTPLSVKSLSPSGRREQANVTGGTIISLTTEIIRDGSQSDLDGPGMSS